LSGSGFEKFFSASRKTQSFAMFPKQLRRQVNEEMSSPHLVQGSSLRVAEDFLHVDGSEMLRESAIEPHEPDRLFQFPEVLVDVRAGQNSMQFACLIRTPVPFAAVVSPALPNR